jgi:hypothetical protein
MKLLSSDLLSIYLNDHRAGAVGGRELARRMAASNQGTELGAVISELLAEIEEDFGTLEEIMSSLDARKDRLKPVAAWAGEKLGRMKPNGRLTSYSPLSRLLELEMLSLGVEGKRALWRSLQQASSHERRLAGFDFTALEARASRQRDRLEKHRLQAAAQALDRQRD